MSKKILLIEDEEELGKTLKKFLEQQDYIVTYLNEVTRDEIIHVENPDLIITDLLMPHIHGFDICKKVKSDPSLKNIPIIAMTAVYKDYFYKMEALRIGVEAFLEKPIRFSELLKKIRELLGEKMEDESESSFSGAVIKEKNEPPVKPRQVKEEFSPEKLSDTEVIASPPFISSQPVSPPSPGDISKSASNGEPHRSEKVSDTLFNGNYYEYISSLPKKIKEMETLWDRIVYKKSTQNLTELLTEFRAKVQNLTDSHEYPGFEDFGEFTSQISLLIDMILTEGEQAIPRRKNKINELLDRLRHHPIISTELDVARQEGNV